MRNTEPLNMHDTAALMTAVWNRWSLLSLAEDRADVKLEMDRLETLFRLWDDVQNNPENIEEALQLRSLLKENGFMNSAGVKKRMTVNNPN